MWQVAMNSFSNAFTSKQSLFFSILRCLVIGELENTEKLISCPNIIFSATAVENTIGYTTAVYVF